VEGMRPWSIECHLGLSLTASREPRPASTSIHFQVGYPGVYGIKSLPVFTGLIEEVGKVLWIRATEHGTELEISAPGIARSIRTGQSIAVNGCCLTVKAHRAGQVTFDLLEETLERTNLTTLRRESLVNLERSLPADGRVGGHFVLGHIDCATRVVSLEEAAGDFRLEVELPPEFSHYVVFKGSIAVNGISLTVAEVSPKTFTVWIIPHTKRNTNLLSTIAGDQVNIEFDILAKYIERMLAPYAPQN
jgi:riboflavin synthase